MIEPVRVGVIGCGVISGIYLQNMQKYKPLEVLACADLDVDRAKAVATEHGVPKACSVDELLADNDIELVVNLTVPVAHADVNNQILGAGKHAYAEKPLATTRADAEQTLKLAHEKGLLIGCAPDTFLGASLQTCRKLIDDGAIGEPIGAHCFMMGHGPEDWVPQPHGYYKIGTGPLLDMGPYYITALVNLMGPIRRVSGSARITFPVRTIPSGPRKGEEIIVETPTHIVGVMDFENGAVAQLTCSTDVWGTRLPNIEIYGSEGAMSVPDPNQFTGEIEITRASNRSWTQEKLTHRFGVNSRGIGVMDMAYAIRTGRPHRSSGALAFHVLDTMQSILEASEESRYIEVASTVSRPEALPITDDDLDLLR